MNIIRWLSPSRRWLQFRLRTVFVVATALCIYLSWPHIARQYAFWRLCQIGERDFGILWTAESLEFQPTPAEARKMRETGKLIRRVLPTADEYENSVSDEQNSRWWSVQRADHRDGRLLLVHIQPPIVIPGSGKVRIVLFDRWGRVIGDKAIWTGNRVEPIRIAYDEKEHAFPYLTVDGYTWRQFRCRQEIAIRPERIAVVRLTYESEESGTVQRLKTRHSLGPDQRFADHSAWSKALMSRDDIDVLEALLYLPPAEAIAQRDPADIERLEALAQSSDPWIREGATAALAAYRN
jgi:hypothetical protein